MDRSLLKLTIWLAATVALILVEFLVVYKKDKKDSTVLIAWIISSVLLLLI